jgi:glycosyltransferase involved in cell wall biosynthesis
MDTYLEQLLKNGLSFSIYSQIKKPEVYQEKVDALKLRDSVIDFALKPRLLLCMRALRSPLKFIEMFSKQDLQSTGTNKIISALKCFNFLKVIENFEDIDLIHAHEEIAGYEFLFLAILSQKPLIITFHGLPPDGVGQLDLNKRSAMYRYCSAVIVNTEFAKWQVVKLGAPQSKIKILPQGLPIEEFPFRPRKSPTDSETLQLISVGRYHRDKGQHYTLIAVRRLLDHGYRVHLRLVGVGSSGRKWLEALICKLGINDSVSFFEDVSSEELLSLYHASHVFILASTTSKSGAHTETQGVAIQESQSAGLIPIVTKVGGIPECVINGENSLVINERSSKAIFNAVKNLIENNRQWLKLRENARLHVEEKFSAHVVGAEMKEILASAFYEHKNKH